MRPRICRNCGRLERHHDASGIIYGGACDDYQEIGDDVEAASGDTNREMGLPEGTDWGNK